MIHRVNRTGAALPGGARVLVVLLFILGALGAGAWRPGQGAPAAAAHAHGRRALTSAAPTATTVHFFRPWAAGGHLAAGITITDIFSGSCFSGSLVSARADAWRCFAGANSLADPCFAPADVTPRAVLCAPDPTAGRVIILLLTATLPRAMGNKGKPGDGDPWTIELASGARCGWISGATTATAAGRLNYGCAPRGSVFGDVDRRSQPWTVQAWLGSDRVVPKPAQLVRVAVTSAWF